MRNSIHQSKKIDFSNNKLNILMVGCFPPPIVGSSVANQFLFDELIKKGYKIEKVNLSMDNTFGSYNSQGKLSIKKILFAPRILKNILNIIFNRERRSIIYIVPGQLANSYILKYFPFMLAAHIRRIPYVIHIHGGYFRTMYNSTQGCKRKIIDWSLRNVDGAIVLGESLRYMFDGLLPSEKVFVCENGVPDEIFATKDEIKQKIEKHKKDDMVRIIYLSNLMKTKGILDLFEAVKILKNKGIKVHLDVAGAIESEISNEVSEYLSELSDCVKYYGVVKSEKKKQILLQNYIFCLPTYYYFEGQPMSILEAMACGCVIVTTDHGGIKDIVNETYGIFVDKKTPTSIAEGIEIANSTFSEKSMEAWIEATEKYTLAKFIECIEKVVVLVCQRF